MNERIRELVNKSISDVDYIRDDDFTNEELSKMYIPDCFAVKFAELIVLEMCNVLDKAQWDKGQDWICADGTRIIPQIKEHFGVE